jgi:hypothetical protein
MSKIQEIPTRLSKEQLIQYLHEGVVTVLFTKTDGTERVMRCTLQESVIPKAPEVTEEQSKKPARKVNENNISVWDVENDGWRSFRVDSVLEIHK